MRTCLRKKIQVSEGVNENFMPNTQYPPQACLLLLGNDVPSMFDKGYSAQIALK